MTTHLTLLELNRTVAKARRQCSAPGMVDKRDGAIVDLDARVRELEAMLQSAKGALLSGTVDFRRGLAVTIDETLRKGTG